MGTFEAVYHRSLLDPAGFWEEAVQDIDWVRPAERVLDDSGAPFYRWFVGGVLNTCHNALDRHVEDGRGDQIALVYDSPSPPPFSTLPTRSCAQRSPGSLGRWPPMGFARATGS